MFTTQVQRALAMIALTAAMIGPPGAGRAGAADAAASPSGDGIPYAYEQTINPGDPEAVILDKAAHVLPRPRQTAWFRLERTFFLHFGPNTFRHVEWGNGREDPAVFNPTELDAEQWVRTVRDGGGKMIVLVCKHHDGLALWPSRYTGHSVAASPWRDGKGNLVREVADAAHKYGIKLGVYLSPADLYQLRTNPINPGGYYGDNSPQVESLIPTAPASFKTAPSQGRAPADGFGSYTYKVDDYNRYFLNQLYELLTEYGPIEEVWFDGANPDPSVHETYNYNAWYDLIRKLQPQAVIFGKGPDGRWVGNEGGVGRTTEWSVIPLPTAPEDFRWPDMTDQDLGSRSKLVAGSHLWWYPAEVNLPILYGWFWAPGKGVRSAADLVNVYYQSVGRNGIWLLNLSPDSRGLIPDDQVASVKLMQQVVSETFKKNLAEGAMLTADSSNPDQKPALVLDGDLDTWWEAAEGQSTGALTLKLPAPVTFDVVSLREAVDHRGQRVESFDVDAWDGSQWKPVEMTEEHTTIGFHRLMRLRQPVTTDQVRVRITQSRTEPTLAEVGLYKQAELLREPEIGERNAGGMVMIPSGERRSVYFTLDGSMPTTQSFLYDGPLDLSRGGTVHAAFVDSEGRLGMIATRTFVGMAPRGWKVVPADGQSDSAANAIDGDFGTVWQSADTPMPHALTVDMGKPVDIAGFSYAPPRGQGRGRGPGRGRNLAGVVERYRFETSADGKTWTTAKEGSFGNMRNNPVAQEVEFGRVRGVRFFRFTALSPVEQGSGLAAAAEITVLPADPMLQVLR